MNPEARDFARTRWRSSRWYLRQSSSRSIASSIDFTMSSTAPWFSRLDDQGELWRVMMEPPVVNDGPGLHREHLGAYLAVTRADELIDCQLPLSRSPTDALRKKNHLRDVVSRPGRCPRF